jgi:hypothetical protein
MGASPPSGPANVITIPFPPRRIDAFVVENQQTPFAGPEGGLAPAAVQQPPGDLAIPINDTAVEPTPASVGEHGE